MGQRTSVGHLAFSADGEAIGPDRRTLGIIDVDETRVRAWRSTEVSADLDPCDAIACEERVDLNGGGMVALQVARLARDCFGADVDLRLWGDTRAEVIGSPAGVPKHAPSFVEIPGPGGQKRERYRMRAHGCVIELRRHAGGVYYYATIDGRDVEQLSGRRRLWRNRHYARLALIEIAGEIAATRYAIAAVGGAR